MWCATMDETWIHHYAPEINRQSAEWRAKGQSRPKRPKTLMSAGEVFASIFWDAHGILFIDYLKKRRINSEYYMTHFELKYKSFYKKGIEMLEKCWNECITFEVRLYSIHNE